MVTARRSALLISSVLRQDARLAELVLLLRQHLCLLESQVLAHLAEEQENPLGFFMAGKAEESVAYEPPHTQ